MLVVSRKNQQGIQIGNDIVIRVVKTGANRVQIGVEAPNDVRVMRLELSEAISSVEPLEFTIDGERVGIELEKTADFTRRAR